MKKNMYAVIVMFALALLSPLPFISPFTSADASDESPFQTQPNSNVPTPDSPVKTSATDGPVELVASQITSDTIVIKAAVDNEPSFAIVANSTEIPFDFPTDVFSLSGSDNDGNAITNENSESWFAHEHIEYSYIENGTPNLPLFVNPPDSLIYEDRRNDFGLEFGSSMTNLGDVDGDGISDIAIGASGEGDTFTLFPGNRGNYLTRDQGAFYILLMNDDGTIKSSTKFDSETENMPSLRNYDTGGIAADAQLGSSIVSLGDLYNDGTFVLAVGADFLETNISGDGAVYILHIGGDGTTILDSFIITPDTLGVNFPLSAGFGYSLANIGDVDNNGVPDLAVGVIGIRLGTGVEFAGGVVILHMGENATSVLKLAANISSQLLPDVPDSNRFDIGNGWDFGSSLELLKTYDDGTISLAIGAGRAGPVFAQRVGYIYIVNMTDQATVVSSRNVLDHTTPNLGLNERNYNIEGLSGINVDVYSRGTFGTSMVNMGDLNGNGVNDILVGYPYLNSIGGAYLLYMNSDNSVQHTAKFQINRIHTENGTNTILNDDQEQIDTYRKYFNYSNPPNMPTSMFQNHVNTVNDENESILIDLGTAVVNLGDVHNDGYADFGLSSPLINHGTILVIDRLGPVVNVTFNPNYDNVETIHYRPTTTDFITVNGIELHNDLDIVVEYNVPPNIVNVTLQSPGTFTITFQNDIDSSSVDISDFTINGIVYTGTVSVSGAVVTLSTSGIFATDVVNTVSIVGEVLDLLGNAANIGHSSSTTSMQNMEIMASRINKNTFTLNFTNTLSLSSDNTDVNAFLVAGATVVSWSITGTVITITTSGLTGTHETPTVAYDPTHSTNLEISTGIVSDYITIRAVDEIPPEYIDTLASDLNTLIIQFSEKLGAISLDENDFTLVPNYALSSIDIIDENIVLTTEDFITQVPTVAYTALINDSLGNAELQSSTAVLASDIFGPKLIDARTVDINAIDLVFQEEFTQTVFDKSSIIIDNLEVKNVRKINQTTLQVTTEQFSTDHVPESVRVNTALTDAIGNDNILGDTITSIKDGIAPIPYFMYDGFLPIGFFNSRLDVFYRTIVFSEDLYLTLPSKTEVLSDDVVMIYNTSGLPLPISSSNKAVTIFTGQQDLLIVSTYENPSNFHTISFINITGPINDTSGNFAELGTRVYSSDYEIPIMTSASVIDDNTIAATFNRAINYSTVSIQDFTVNASITISDVLTRGNTIYLTTDTLLPRESYLVNLVGSVADYYFNNVTNPTSVTALYETVIAENLTITSDNVNPKYAQSGDTLTVNLTVDQVLTSVTATIFGSDVQPVSTNKTITINTAVPANVVDGFATFAINVETENGSVRTFTQNDLTDNSNVLIDNTNPSFVSGSYDFTKLVHLTFSENISSASAYEHDNNIEISTTIDGPVVTLDTTSIENTDTLVNATVYDYAGNSYSLLPINISSLISPIEVFSLSITNNGASIVRADQNITVTLVADSTDLANFTGILLGKDIDINPSAVAVNNATPGTAIFTTTVLPTDTNGNITFSITATNSSGSQLFVTDENITDGSFVTVDTVKPVITLNGNSPDTVLQGENYLDQNGTVSDPNNSLYIQSVTASPPNLNTSSLGEQNITYSAPPDAAGNIPDSINRTVTVLAKPLGIDTLTIESSNVKNSSYAKNDDLITITLDANGTINSATATIASNTATLALTDDELVATYTVDSTFSQGSIGFSIDVSNEDDTVTSTFTETDLPGSNIIIDTIAPSISLIGNNNTVVPTNSSYTDPGATATDASYTSDLTVTGANTDFDITNAGNYTFTYTAEDEAGNTDTITRNVIVKDTPPIGINALEIESNNTNTLYAKIGDAIYFTLNVNNTINFSNVARNVPGTNVFNIEKGGSDNELYVDAIVLDTTVIESNATFTITIANANGTTLTVTKDDLTTSNVFIDTIPPRIAPIGGSVNYSIVNGTENPTILNVTVDDGDPNYSGNYTLITNGTVNANLNGSIYNYTYTADADSAGNPGDSLTRIITIIDADPIAIESLSIASSPGNPNFANLGKTITVTLVTKDSTNLGNFTGTLLGRDIVKNDVSSGTVEFTETVSLGDADGNVTFSIVMTNSSGNRIHITNININDSSFVTIDTTKPVITLTDPSSNTVFKGDAYSDPSATVSDLNYLSSPTVTALPANLVTSSLGPQTITYSGSADAAGNVPDDVIRTVTVLAKPLGIDTLTIESSNTNNPSYAKIDDLITITLDANGTINSATTIVASNTTTPTLTDDELVAAYTVDSTFSQGSLGFSIAVSNEDDTVTSTFTQADLPGSSIIIDTIAPSISLIDNNNTIVPTNSSYTDPGATATDASYTSNLTVTGANTDFDITNAGNYTFTYTAEDEAGNTHTITRNVIVKDIPPIGINALEIESDNANTLYAKVGDDIYFTLNVNNTINFSNVARNVPGTTVFNVETGSSNNELYVDARVLDTTVIESNATFTITIANTNGTTLTVTQDDLTTSNVFIDTIPPRIATDDGGPADYFLVNGTENPTIRNVTVTDGDLNYSGNYTLTTNATVNANMNGSVYNYTYTADADTAGNPGDSLTRIITIIDAPLINITSLSITSNSGNNFANEGKTITLGLETDSNNLGNFTGTILGKTFTPTTSGGTATFTVPVSSSDTNGNVTFSIVVTNSTGGRVSFTEADITDDSFVTIDTIAPNITLNGENNTIVALDAEYTDPGAAITDQGNPSYVGTITTTPATLDTSSTGDKIITYTGSADAAGNVPDSIIRIVSVKDAPPIDITRLTLEGNVGNTSYAKGGDTVDFSLEINYTIASYTITIFNKTTSVASFSSSTITLTETVPTSLTVEEYATFSITIVDGDGLPNTLTQEDLTSGNVFIDTIPPSLTLISGPANYSIVNGTESPIIRNVTAHDGDPYYSGNYTLITPNGIVNADINGSVYSYTYTAVADGAGNLGASLTRIITIVDALQIGVTSLSITSNSGNNFANADKIITLRLQTDSDDLHDITGTLLGREFESATSGGSATFTTTVLSGDTNGNVTFSIEALNSSDGRVVISESDITDGSFVTIDTVLPVITLNGENNTIVAVGADYTDPSATVADQGNPSYAGTITARPATLDTSSVGNKTITYTAPADAAGNVPVPKIRIVSVEDAPPIDITLFTITSDNSNNSYAKAGDTLSIQSSINYTIASYTATIFGIEQSESNQNSNGFLISQQVPSNLTIEEYATFSITIIDEKGLPNIITENTQITSSQLPPNNVFIDTISPTITKLLPESITFEANADLSNITTTVNDGAPNYVTSITIDPSTIVNTSIPGVYPFTYSAPDDAAGNLGQSATINFIVKDENGSTVLNSSIIDDTPQSFSNSESIKAEIHDNNVNASNTLELSSPIVELDVSGIITTTGSSSHAIEYPHPLDLIVNNRISAQIESGTVLTFTADPSDKDNFTVKYLPDDGHNDDAIQLGLENVRYALTNDAIAITFERVSSSPTVFIRENNDDPYMNVTLYSGVITDGASAYTIIKATNSIYDSAGALYTHDTTTRTVTLWTTHLSTAKENSTSSSGGGDESDSNSPTLGKTSSGAQLVTNGFEYNGLTVNVDRYHTEFPLIGTNVGDINTISMKIYDSAGPSGIKRVEFALGVPDIGLYHEAEAFVEVWMQRDSVAVQETIIVDELNLLEDSDVSATVSQTSCSDGAQQCLLVELQYSYREPPAYNTISIKPVDWDNNAHQFYFNDGIHVDGDSINLPKEITISASHAADTTHAGETLHLVQIDRAEHLWVDQYGYQWMIIGNTVRQITVPEYLVPNDNTYGKLHGPDRNHPEFASSVYAEQQRAQETLAEILGHATIIKPLPESGGTIYFDATGTDSRSGDSFKLLLELETARMQQLSNLLYDDTN